MHILCNLVVGMEFGNYNPFGMLLPGRSGSSESYRYGFQGQEGDPEIKGEGNSVNYKFRMHDPRIGRFFAPDPLTQKYPHYSPYSFSGNKVIASVELEGLEDIIYTEAAAPVGEALIGLASYRDVFASLLERVADENHCNQKVYVGAVNREEHTQKTGWHGQTYKNGDIKTIMAPLINKVEDHMAEIDSYNQANGTQRGYSIDDGAMKKYNMYKSVFNAAGLTAETVLNASDDETFNIILLSLSDIEKLGNVSLNAKAMVLNAYIHELDAHLEGMLKGTFSDNVWDHYKYFGYDPYDPSNTEEDKLIIEKMKSGVSPGVNQYKEGSEAKINYDEVMEGLMDAGQ